MMPLHKSKQKTNPNQQLKNNMQKYSFFLVFLIFFSSLSAQVSGYRGKRFLVEVQPIVAFNWYLLVLLGDDPKLSISPGIHTEYALSRSNAIALDYQFSSSKEKMVFPLMENSSSKYSVQYNYLTRVSGHTVGINYRHYYVRKSSSWGVAPIGSFVGFGVGHCFGLKANTEDSPLSYASPKGVKNTFVKIEVGSRNVLFNWLTLNYSVSLATMARKRPPYFLDSNNNDYYPLTMINSYNENAMNNSLRFANSFTANVGFGVFLF